MPRQDELSNLGLGRPPDGPQTRFRGNNDLQELQIFGLNELPAERRRTRGAEDSLFDTANQVGLSERIAAARDRTRRGADVDAGIFERQTRGLSLTDRQKRAATRRLGLTRRLAEASSANAERRGSRNRALEAFRAGGELEDLTFSQEIAGLTQLANAEGRAQSRHIQRQAQGDANRRSLIGTGIGLFAMLSSEDAKDKQGKESNMLDKLRKIRVERWNYKGDKDAHIGAFAEEFNDTFRVNQNNRHMISLVDAVGVIMGGLKELDQKVEARG